MEIIKVDVVDESIKANVSNTQIVNTGGGTNNYNKLSNLPKINGITLKDDLTTKQLGIIEDVENYIEEHKEELKGDKGDRGEQGIQGIQGEDGNGIESINKTSTSGLVDTYTINYTNGNTTTFNVTNGEQGIQGEKGDKGDTGEKGEQGIQGEVGPVGPQGIQGEQGPQGEQGVPGEKGKDGYTPVKGVDYFTEADKQEMVNTVINSVNDELGLLIDEINGEVI